MSDTSLPDPLLPDPLLMDPHFSKRPWGGTRLAQVLRKHVPAEGGPWGEAWELSDHPEGRSSVANGPFAGRSFGDLIRTFPMQLCGCPAPPKRFPLLVKYIDATKDLSIQVHPNDAQAACHGDRGKNECWYVMDCEPGAQIIHGLARGVDRRQLRDATLQGRVETCVRRMPIAPGDFLYVPAGTIHAILAGTLICEIQQSSNLTYRLWDWNRKPARALHLDEACEAVSCDAHPPDILHTRELPAGDWQRLVDDPFFRVWMGRWKASEQVEIHRPNPHGLIINVVAGGGRLEVARSADEPLTIGQTWFLPSGLERWRIEASGAGIELLLSESLEIY